MQLSIPVTGTWTIVCDAIMGGRSTRTVRETDDGTIRFAGTISLDDDGGFASARIAVGELNPSGFSGLRLRPGGDGRRRQVRLRTDQRCDGGASGAGVGTTREWETVEVPFTAFEPTFRGYRPPGAPPLDPSGITELDLLIAHRKAGKFALGMAGAHAYAPSADPTR